MTRYQVYALRPRIISVTLDAESETEAEEITRQAVNYALSMEMGYLKVEATEVAEEWHGACAQP